MSNPSKQKGTAAETAVVRLLRYHWPAERRALHGALDKGDIAGVPGVVVEVKNCARMELAGWLDQALVERDNADELIGVVWHKRRGKPHPGDWFVTMNGHDFVKLLLRGEADED